jgi:hypothetical protein
MIQLDFVFQSLIGLSITDRALLIDGRCPQSNPSIDSIHRLNPIIIQQKTDRTVQVANQSGSEPIR